jgi:hypothetical protein
MGWEGDFAICGITLGTNNHQSSVREFRVAPESEVHYAKIKILQSGKSRTEKRIGYRPIRQNSILSNES